MDADETKGALDTLRKRVDIPLKEWNQLVELSGKVEPIEVIRGILNIQQKQMAAWPQIEAEARARKLTAQAIKEEVQVLRMLKEDNLDVKKFGQRAFCFTHHIWEDPDSECFSK